MPGVCMCKYNINERDDPFNARLQHYKHCNAPRARVYSMNYRTIHADPVKWRMMKKEKNTHTHTLNFFHRFIYTWYTGSMGVLSLLMCPRALCRSTWVLLKDVLIGITGSYGAERADPPTPGVSGAEGGRPGEETARKDGQRRERSADKKRLRSG